MAEPTKDELVQQAEDLGVPDAESKTKAELADAIEARDRLGPTVPAGQVLPDPEKPGANAIEGISPLEPEDIPEAAR